MARFGKILKKIRGSHLQIAGVLALVALAAFLLWFNNSTSTQPDLALVGGVRFKGTYSIDGGEPKQIVEGEHIPSTHGDVTLRGNFHAYAPDGTYAGIHRGELAVAFYLDHIHLTIDEGIGEPFVGEIEDPKYGDANCGETWIDYTLVSEPDQTVEIIIHNPHSFGNETAIDEMLSRLALWTGIDFGKEALESGDTQRNIGIVLMLVSIVFLGIALFSSLIHIKNSKLIWLLGLVVLFAGLYFIYSSDGISFWSDSRVSNTTILGASMMLYMLLVSMIVICLLTVTKRIVNIAVLALTLANAVFFILPIASDVLFYDTLPFWVLVQTAVNITISVCLFIEYRKVGIKERALYIGAFLPMVAFSVDTFGTYFGLWKGGIVSQYVFIALLFVAVLMVLKLIPGNINAATKAKALEMEKIVLNAQLAETRISTMMSQIRPHFIYNTLGSIEQLCEIDPPKAGELVHDFAKYLRGNFGELDNPRPIPMTKEMEHVHHYISIENVRFPDMTFSFEMNSEDFSIPALTIQPIVENAVKHGLMKLQKGGTIRVVSYESDSDYCVSVTDDGVGFDTSLLLDDRKHVGLRNIRERLKTMVGGSIEIESTVGVGTRVLIKIPKEIKNDSNSR